MVMETEKDRQFGHIVSSRKLNNNFWLTAASSGVKLKNYLHVCLYLIEIVLFVINGAIFNLLDSIYYGGNSKNLVRV